MKCGEHFCAAAACTGLGASAVCTQRCLTANDCPPQEQCFTVDHGAWSVSVCLASPPVGQFSQPCASDLECVTGVCVGGNDEGFCSFACAPLNKCPEGWNCRYATGEFENPYCWPSSPGCAGRQCGPGEGGQPCGTCPPGSACHPDGLCDLKWCVRDCKDRTCGPDSCGGNCGECACAETCVEGTCAAGTQTPCDGVECGVDKFGCFCGACLDPAEVCLVGAGKCVDVDSYVGKGCAASKDCATGLCGAWELGGICTVPCIEKIMDCPAGMLCTEGAIYPVPFGPAGTMPLCLPEKWRGP